MNRKHIFASLLSVAGVGIAAFSAVAGPKVNVLRESTFVQPLPGQSSSAAVIESTGFEVPQWDLYTAGQSNNFCGIAYWTTCQPTPFANSCVGVPATDVNCCVSFPNTLNSWYTSASSQHCREPHIDIIHPATGSQHLRFTRDPLGGNPAGSTGFSDDGVNAVGTHRQSAFSPFLASQPINNTVIDFDIATDAPNANTLAANFQFDTQGTGATSGVGTLVYFYSLGYIYILDRGTPPGGYQFAGPFNPDGNYYHFRIDKNICLGFVKYYYGDMVTPILTTNLTGESYGVNQGVWLHDNSGGTSFWDWDNYQIVRAGACPAVCGNGILEPGEGCDPGTPPQAPALNGCTAARCRPDCVCDPVCTLAAPCPVVNGENGPFIGPCDAMLGCFFSYTGNSPAIEADFCGTTGAGVDTFIAIYDGAAPGAPLATNDDCCDASDPNCGSFGDGSSPNASCYDNVGAPNYNACTCTTSPSNNYLIREATPARNGTVVRVNINKKAVCGGTVLGSCCGINGICVDDVAQAACQGTWNNEKCAQVTCVCQPQCQGRVCGPDGCGGTCGSCGDNNVCNGIETCNAAGQCDPGQPLNCSDGLACNGAEVCDPVSGCGPGTAPNCDDGNACTIDSCVEPNGCAHAPRVCDDGLACNGVETCNPATGCVAGTPPDCDDGVECTVDGCDETVDGNCTHDDAGCFTPIPTVSQWGVAVMALLLLIGAKIYFTRRQSVSA